MKVNCPSGNTIEVEINENDSVLDLKEKIHDKTGTPAVHQQLKIVGKKTLSKRHDKKKISSLHLNNESMLNMSYVLAGGCGVGCDLCGCGGECCNSHLIDQSVDFGNAHENNNINNHDDKLLNIYKYSSSSNYSGYQLAVDSSNNSDNYDNQQQQQSIPTQIDIIQKEKKKRTRRTKAELLLERSSLEGTAAAATTTTTTGIAEAVSSPKKRTRKSKSLKTTELEEIYPIKQPASFPTIQLPSTPLRIRIVDNNNNNNESTKNDMSYIGVDEAGKGAVLGPLVIAAVSLDSAAEQYLKAAGVKDSKKLSAQRREELYDIIKERALYTTIYILEARDIDIRRKTQTLNKIESDIFLELIQRSLNHLKSNPQEFIEEVEENNNIVVGGEQFNNNSNKPKKYKIQLDSLESNTGKFSLPFRDAFPAPEHTVICENQADSKYVSTGAASIIAKVERDRAIAALEKSVNTPVGCGYPSDATTLTFIESYYQRNGNDHPDVRLSWKTLTNKRGINNNNNNINNININNNNNNILTTQLQSNISSIASQLETATNNDQQSSTQDQLTILQNIQQDLSALTKSVQSFINLLKNNKNNK
ncbi:hypothetical protein PPL_06719 [Heterostelium album PN500]|uniref:Ribonuclease n=1 Tax=Heterostelium pallidum (strain ATCC 26659 / Pp 5 / PN500) TaxID=670386 RepID=D3BFI5_HETP5|nr:hypothetical protein PPL_06719 [Heterostelium album PN500]EFA79899.1 hypothetical protein PPL_06719 [Heterostelium album PN500]|eukprot:XP_020432020.1 hypothetical protein PPL_06719 [Heterostelium album PN500]